MKGQGPGPLLSTIFVDYDNIYLSLKRKNEEAARRFAKDAAIWLRAIETGDLITATNGSTISAPRRVVLNRVYGNPIPRRNASDNSTDMNSFPFVRHHFLRAGMEAVDCSPLTSQLKNSADIRMVMDVRDLISHDTYYDEFIILSGDADFTPLLHRLRAHARRTVVFANDHTAAPYTAVADGEIREADLIALLLDGRGAAVPDGSEGGEVAATAPTQSSAPSVTAQIDAVRRDIIAEVVGWVRSAGQPVPLEALADRAVRMLGHDRTVGTGWGGAGSFMNLLTRGLPADIRLTDQPPYFVFETNRAPTAARPRDESAYQATGPTAGSVPHQARQTAPMHVESAQSDPSLRSEPRFNRPDNGRPMPQEAQRAAPQSGPLASGSANPLPQKPVVRTESAATIQQSITRIHEACQAPPLAPPEYRALFDVMAKEISTNGLTGAQTLTNIIARAADLGVEIKRDDVRFVLEVVSETDPWFEQGASPNLFASRFRNFVIARCRGQGLQLSSEELDLIDAWFGGSPMAQRAAVAARETLPSQPAASAASYPASGSQSRSAAQAPPGGERWWSADEGRHYGAASGPAGSDDEMPLIVRNRLRG